MVKSIRKIIEARAVAHAYNPSYSGGRDPEDPSSRLAQTVSKTPSQPIITWTWWYTPVIPALGEA
jgi:hypothetical protein